MSKFIQTYFFHHSTFPLTTKQKREKLKFFSILPHFHSLTIFHSFSFLPIQPNEPLVLVVVKKIIAIFSTTKYKFMATLVESNPNNLAP